MRDLFAYDNSAVAEKHIVHVESIKTVLYIKILRNRYIGLIVLLNTLRLQLTIFSFSISNKTAAISWIWLASR